MVLVVVLIHETAPQAFLASVVRATAVMTIARASAFVRLSLKAIFSKDANAVQKKTRNSFLFKVFAITKTIFSNDQSSRAQHTVD